MSCASLRTRIVLTLARVTACVTLAFVTLACVSTGAHANFKYIPAGQTESRVAPAPAPVTSSPLSAPGPGSPIGAGHGGAGQAMSGGEVISGFGTQVPLVMALREIVPSSYQFAFAEGLNLGTLVNWKGGRPWRDVLRGVVTQVGLTATERNAVIYVERGDSSADLH